MNNEVNRAPMAKNNRFFKTTTLIAAIGVIAYTLYILTHYIIHVSGAASYHYELWNDICERLIIDILPLSLIVAGIGLLRFRPTSAASKAFRIFTICLLAALLVTLLVSPLYTYRLAGAGYLFPSIYWRLSVLVAAIVWLFMLRRQPTEEASSRWYQALLILTMILLAAPILLEAVSGISLLCGHGILGFHSAALKTWVRWFAPALMLLLLCLPMRSSKKQ
jgi:hypothetical protein